MARIHGIELKKAFGQHFLHDHTVTEAILSGVGNIAGKSIFEIGPGNGFLTQAILEAPIKKLWAFEIDEEWVDNLKKNITDSRLTLFQIDFLLVDIKKLEKNGPWIILANLPYNITFPILERLVMLSHVIEEGVIMVQEEVAQKLAATSGKAYGATSIFFQHYFDFRLLAKIPPESFNPPPRVFSRLVYLKPSSSKMSIKNEQEFFRFVRFCFKQPRRTLKNNLIAAKINVNAIDPKILNMRAQQLNVEQLIVIFELVNS